MKTKTNKINISSVAPVVLFAFFAICVMTVLLLGTKLYQTQIQRDMIGYNQRTVSQYISTRIHQSDKYDSYFVADFNDKIPQSEGNAFFFTETINGAQYYTCIYCHDGYLYELFASMEDPLDVDAGERILQVKSVTFINDEKNITINIVHTNESTQTLVINIRTSGGNPQ